MHTHLHAAAHSICEFIKMILDLYFLKLILPLLRYQIVIILHFVKMALFILLLHCTASFSLLFLLNATQRGESICVHMKLHCAYLLRNANELLGKSCVIKFYSLGRIEIRQTQRKGKKRCHLTFMGI